MQQIIDYPALHVNSYSNLSSTNLTDTKTQHIVYDPLNILNTNKDDLQSESKEIVFTPILRNSNQKANYPTRLSRIQYNILCLMRDDHLVQGFFEREQEELTRRFNTSISTLEKTFSYLNKIGFTTSKRQGGKCAKRWITFDGFAFLDNKLTELVTEREIPIPYIDLSKNKEGDKEILIEAEQETSSAQNKDDFKSMTEEELLILIFSLTNMSVEKKLLIQFALKRTEISSNRKLDLLRRIAWMIKNNAIKRIESYLMASLKDEERKQAFAREYFTNLTGYKHIHMMC